MYTEFYGWPISMPGTALLTFDLVGHGFLLNSDAAQKNLRSCVIWVYNIHV